eukprot:9424528-Ditylum_brightwellii.AAC.2
MQCQVLQQVLKETPEVFDSNLWLYPHQKVHLEVQEGAKPYHAKAYSVPCVHMKVFKKELTYLVEIEVLRPCGPTEWAIGTFIVPKKDGRVQWLDLSMFFYTLELDEKSKELCTMVTPFGKFQYCKMAIGLKMAPGIAQAIIKEILCGKDVETYLDDVGIFSNGEFKEHMKLVTKVLQQLHKNNMK